LLEGKLDLEAERRARMTPKEVTALVFKIIRGKKSPLDLLLELGRHVRYTAYLRARVQVLEEKIAALYKDARVEETEFIDRTKLEVNTFAHEELKASAWLTPN